jgi:hypothetical protein
MLRYLFPWENAERISSNMTLFLDVICITFDVIRFSYLDTGKLGYNLSDREILLAHLHCNGHCGSDELTNHTSEDRLILSEYINIEGIKQAGLGCIPFLTHPASLLFMITVFIP